MKAFPEMLYCDHGDGRIMKKKRKVLYLILFVLIVILTVIVYHSASIWLYADKDETCSADVAIVLGAAAYESGPSPVYRERLNQGIRLYREGYVGKIILTGGTAEGNILSDAAIGRAYVTSHGVSDCDVILEEQSTITEENLYYAADIMKREGYSTALIVSDPLHMKRAMAISKDAGIESFSSPTHTSMYQGMWSKLRFLIREVVLYVGYRLMRCFNVIRECLILSLI